MMFGESGQRTAFTFRFFSIMSRRNEKWRGKGGGGSRRDARTRKEVLINNSRWWRIRKRVKSIGVMTRGKAEAKYFLSQWENLRFAEIEKEKCVEEKGEDRDGGGRRRGGTRPRRQASRWNKGGGRVECIYVVAPFEPHKRKKNFRPALSLKSRWKSLTTLNYGAERYPWGERRRQRWRWRWRWRWWWRRRGGRKRPADFAGDKTAFKPKSRRWDRYFVLLVSPHVVDGARVRRHMWTWITLTWKLKLPM